MECDWIFLNSDGSKEEVTLEESGVPLPGDGKFHHGRGYSVAYVIQGRTTNPNPAVVAREAPVSASGAVDA